MKTMNDLPAAIEALEMGKISAPIRIEVREGIALEACDESEIDDLLQRARGLRLISMLAAGESVERSKKPGLEKPALHARVRQILDALK